MSQRVCVERADGSEDKAVSVCWFWVRAPCNLCQRATGDNGGGWGEMGLHDVRGPRSGSESCRVFKEEQGAARDLLSCSSLCRALLLAAGTAHCNAVGQHTSHGGPVEGKLRPAPWWRRRDRSLSKKDQSHRSSNFDIFHVLREEMQPSPFLPLQLRSTRPHPVLCSLGQRLQKHDSQPASVSQTQILT